MIIRACTRTCLSVSKDFSRDIPERAPRPQWGRSIYASPQVKLLILPQVWFSSGGSSSSWNLPSFSLRKTHYIYQHTLPTLDVLHFGVLVFAGLKVFLGFVPSAGTL